MINSKAIRNNVEVYKTDRIGQKVLIVKDLYNPVKHHYFTLGKQSLVYIQFTKVHDEIVYQGSCEEVKSWAFGYSDYLKPFPEFRKFIKMCEASARFNKRRKAKKERSFKQRLQHRIVGKQYYSDKAWLDCLTLNDYATIEKDLLQDRKEVRKYIKFLNECGGKEIVGHQLEFNKTTLDIINKSLNQLAAHKAA